MWRNWTINMLLYMNMTLDWCLGGWEKLWRCSVKISGIRVFSFMCNFVYYILETDGPENTTFGVSIEMFQWEVLENISKQCFHLLNISSRPPHHTEQLMSQIRNKLCKILFDIISEPKKLTRSTCPKHMRFSQHDFMWIFEPDQEQIRNLDV